MPTEDPHVPVEDFGAWLLRFTETDGPQGRLARRFATDPGWPQGHQRLRSYTRHLEAVGADGDSMRVLLDSWIRWATEHRASAPLL
ncbi:hypothetical protein ACIQWN_32580 [Streptomyces vinaceus]|uniref:hypothetical protein n=1 Tax=Streptomyces vinaceus TaxID=1960 RepID=UPI0037F36E2A